MPKISQCEARRLRKRVQELESVEESRLYSWSQTWPNGTHIGQTAITSSDDYKLIGAIEAARKLKHAVVVTVKDFGTLNFHALPISEPKL